MRAVDEWKRVLREALRDAMRSRDAAVISVMRETLAAIDNAEAADPGLAPPPAQDGLIAGAVMGLGAAEVTRRALDARAVTAIVEREIAERRDGARVYASLGRQSEAERLQGQADVLAALM